MAADEVCTTCGVVLDNTSNDYVIPICTRCLDRYL